jgi:hypothetical protein
MDRERAIRKLQACLRLAKSSEPHEAAAALRQAEALMREYGLNEADADAHAFSGFRAGTRYGVEGLPNHLARLARIVASTFGCKPIQGLGARTWMYKTEILFVGPTSSAQVCVYAFTVLRRQLEGQMQRYTRRIKKRVRKVARGAMFADGWIVAVEQKLGVRELSEESRVGIDRWLALRNMQTSTGQARNLVGPKVNQADMVAGYRAGKNVELRDGVAGSAPAQLEQQA